MRALKAYNIYPKAKFPNSTDKRNKNKRKNKKKKKNNKMFLSQLFKAQIIKTLIKGWKFKNIQIANKNKSLKTINNKITSKMNNRNQVLE